MEIEGLLWAHVLWATDTGLKKKIVMVYLEIFKDASDWVLVLSFNKDI